MCETLSSQPNQCRLYINHTIYGATHLKGSVYIVETLLFQSPRSLSGADWNYEINDNPEIFKFLSECCRFWI